MPIHKVKLPDGSMGYQWGRTGKKYKDLEDARRQERAIYASGWREEGESKKANAKGVCGMNYKEWLQKQAYGAENSGTNLIKLYTGGRGLPAKAASLNKSAAHQLAVIIKTAQLKNAESSVQLPKAIQPTGVTGPAMPKTYPAMPKAYKPMSTAPKATAQPVAPAKAPAAIKSPAAAKPAYQQEPDLGGTRTVQPGDTGWKYWKELGGNRHMPYNDWVREFQAANPDIDINKLIPGTVVGLGRSVE